VVRDDRAARPLVHADLALDARADAEAERRGRRRVRGGPPLAVLA